MDTASATGIIGVIFSNAPDLIGIVIPVLISYLNREVVSGKERFIVTIMTCLGASTILNWQNLVYGSPEQVLISAGIIFTESQVVYKMYFEKSVLNLKISGPKPESPNTEAMSNFIVPNVQIPEDAAQNIEL